MVRKKSPVKRTAKKTMPQKWQAAPLKRSFLLLSIVGFLITAYLIYPLSFNLGITFMVVFVAMFIASLISMAKGPIIKE